METTEHIRSILAVLPQKPGIYQYFDRDGQLLYVGKARSLKNRVSSYFTKQQHESGKTALLVRKIADIRYIVVESEMDALLLENSLIKTHKPKYNIVWKDDKSFPSIVIKNEPFPRIYPTRQLIRDGSEYHGPFASVKSMHSMLELARKMYPLRSCSLALTEENILAGKFRVCLEYHLGNCLGPCEGRQSRAEYDAGVDAIRKIIRGQFTPVIRGLKSQMEEAAVSMSFEEAQRIKERLELLEKFQARSTVVGSVSHPVDVFSLATDMDSAYVNYMRVIGGAVVQGYTAELRRKLDETDAEILAYAIVEIRQRFGSDTRKICVPIDPGIEIPGIEFIVPQRGDLKKLLELSHRNAEHSMNDSRKQQEHLDPARHQQRILETLRADLRLKDLPVHIECFDNSNIQGAQPVSACVVFRDAKPSKKDYRIFNVRTVEGPNDFDTMREVIERRYRRMVEEEQSLPQLVIIDGGKGQLSAAVDAFRDLGLHGQVAVIGIAKKLEEIYFPGDTLPLYLDKKSESLKLIQHLRNEAHRFGISKHRNRRSREALTSELDSITGVGAKTRVKLLEYFRSISLIRTSSEEELGAVVGRATARAIWVHFHPGE